MSQEPLGIIEKYNHEIQEIENRLTQLEKGRIYDLTGAQMDGSLHHNAVELRKKIKALLWMIETQAPSFHDKLDIFSRKDSESE